MKVSDILRVKGSTLFTMAPLEPLSRAVEIMAEKDLGSLVVMDHGDLAGMLTFREVILAIVKNGGQVGLPGVAIQGVCMAACRLFGVSSGLSMWANSSTKFLK